MKRLFLLISLLWTQTGQASVPIQKVVSPSGIEAWLVQDHTIPLLAIKFSFEGGMAFDLPGKEGVANLMTDLLTEGAGDLKAVAFHQMLENNSISLSFGAGRDRLYGQAKFLTSKKDLAFKLLKLALTKPRFDLEALDRRRAAVLAQLRIQQANPNWVLARTLNRTLYDGHPYGEPGAGSLKTIPLIQRADLQNFFKAGITKEKLLIAVVGDITALELGRILDDVFAGLPAKTAHQKTVTDVTLSGARDIVLVPRDIPQTHVMMVGPGMKRQNSDWYTAMVMNYILGGGGTSRLMEEIRGKQGLTYGISTSLSTSEHSNRFSLGSATKNETIVAMIDGIKKEWNRMLKKGVTKAELQKAKNYLTGAFSLRLTSTDRIASILLSIQEDDLGMDYLDRRDDLLKAVTQKAVHRVAKRLLDINTLTTVLVGRPVGITPTKIVEEPY